MNLRAQVPEKALDAGIDILKQQDILTICFILIFCFLCFIMWQIIKKLLDEIPKIVDSIKELKEQTSEHTRALDYNTESLREAYKGIQALVDRNASSESAILNLSKVVQEEGKRQEESRERGRMAKEKILQDIDDLKKDMDSMPEKVEKSVSHELKLIIGEKVFQPAKKAK